VTLPWSSLGTSCQRNNAISHSPKSIVVEGFILTFTSAKSSVESLYLDLLIKCISNTIYGDGNKGEWRPAAYDPEARRQGTDWPEVAHSMIGGLRLTNLCDLARLVLSENIPGDFIETGVWRGGACILMRGVLKAYNDASRRVFCADSFEGLPLPDADHYPADAGQMAHKIKYLAVSKDQVEENFRRYDLLDNQVIFLKGWFKDTLPKIPTEQLALIRLDGDLYESTIQALDNLYPKLSIGGFVLVDDYGSWPNCRQAIHDYRDAHGIKDPIVSVDTSGVYWRRTSGKMLLRKDQMRNPHTSLPREALPALQDGHQRYSYKGIPTIKCPFDLALYSLLIWNLKPRTIFEIGSNRGGSALWLADQLRAFKIDGHVRSYDIAPVTEIKDSYITFSFGDAAKLDEVLSEDEIRELPRPFLVIEDSSHKRSHCLSVLKFFAPHFRPNEYIIIEDGIVTDLGIAEEFDGGPAAAIAEFLAEHQSDWEIDKLYCDFFGENVTWNINGYLKKL
jgi:O-methyltransferase